MAAAAPLAASAVLKGAGARTVPVGLELYSVRGELAKDLLGTVAAVGKMGYEIVEFYAPYLEWTPDRAREVRKVLDDSGLKCRSTHNNGPSFTPDGLKKAIELNQIIGSTNVIMASAPRATTVDAWKALGDQLTAVAAQLKPLGMATGYHNHQVEWRPVEGKRPMDVIAASTPPEVVLQFDVGTCVEVGADPIAWIKANPGRIKSVHCKDWAMASGYNVPFGEGAAPWKAIFEAAESTGGVEYYLVEQETGATNGGELPMVQRCLANWKKLRA
jgi:sugar phosphate isomerase/epimerase